VSAPPKKGGKKKLHRIPRETSVHKGVKIKENCLPRRRGRVKGIVSKKKNVTSLRTEEDNGANNLPRLSAFLVGGKFCSEGTAKSGKTEN